ncbi:MAG: DNA-binding HxlR family transcriptional regulator [Alphaproteobacteria bacterium]|jgi:DNA-binding HxlR family transcriptional regulator
MCNELTGIYQMLALTALQAGKTTSHEISHHIQQQINCASKQQTNSNITQRYVYEALTCLAQLNFITKIEAVEGKSRQRYVMEHAGQKHIKVHAPLFAAIYQNLYPEARKAASTTNVSTLLTEAEKEALAFNSQED